VLPFPGRREDGAIVAVQLFLAVVEGALAVQSGLAPSGTATTCPQVDATSSSIAQSVGLAKYGALNDPRLYTNRYQVTHFNCPWGMAMVYRAEDTLLNRAVALKILYPELSEDPLFVERFRREPKRPRTSHTRTSCRSLTGEKITAPTSLSWSSSTGRRSLRCSEVRRPSREPAPRDRRAGRGRARLRPSQRRGAP